MLVPAVLEEDDVELSSAAVAVLADPSLFEACAWSNANCACEKQRPELDTKCLSSIDMIDATVFAAWH